MKVHILGYSSKVFNEILGAFDTYETALKYQLRLFNSTMSGSDLDGFWIMEREIITEEKLNENGFNRPR